MTPNSAPKSFVPEQYFRCLCQNARCRNALGGFHVPHVGAVIVFACHKCQHVSAFKVDAFGITPQLLDRHGRVLDPKELRPVVSATAAVRK